MKILLPMFDSVTKAFTNVTEAEIVNVAPHLSGTFVLHRGIPPLRFAKWCVSDAETGHNIMDGKTRNAVIVDARNRLSCKTEKDLQAAYRRIPKEARQ